MQGLGVGIAENSRAVPDLVHESPSSDYGCVIWARSSILSLMDVFALTRKLIDIESTTGMEAAVGVALAGELTQLGYNVERMPVEGDRVNIWATHPGHPQPALALSTHMDTVPPFIPSSETADRIYGRGSCDAKGIIVAQIAAAEKLKAEGIHVGLLFLVGEERDSQGAQTANQQPRGVKYLINGEPTENRLALASKGTLRVELVARGRMAHSAYPELGESAIEKLLDALHEIRKLKLPENPKAGPCTLNIGQIEGGRAPNVIPDRPLRNCSSGWSARRRSCAGRSRKPPATRRKRTSSWKFRTWNWAPFPASRRWLRSSLPTFPRSPVGASRC